MLHLFLYYITIIYQQLTIILNEMHHFHLDNNLTVFFPLQNLNLYYIIIK